MTIVRGRQALLPFLALLGMGLAACSSSAAMPTAAPATPAPALPAGPVEGPTMAPASQAAAATPVPVLADQTNAPSAGTQPMIIKTGQLELQVSNPDASATQAEGIVTGAGGYVSASTRSGRGDGLMISVTYRIPVARWQSTLDAIHHASGGGSLTIVSEQIQTQDVTASAVDMDAHLTNLRASEQSLLGIMARASSIPDTLAVQDQLTTIRGQIEALQAQRNQLGDQASFSTLTVQFEATPGTQTTTATTAWSINGTIDDATATLVKLGQAAASLAIWLLIVGLPLALVALLAYVVYRVGRRFLRRVPRVG